MVSREPLGSDAASEAFSGAHPSMVKCQRARAPRWILDANNARLVRRTRVLHDVKPVVGATTKSCLELLPTHPNRPIFQCPRHRLDFNPPDRLSACAFFDKIEPRVVRRRRLEGWFVF